MGRRRAWGRVAPLAAAAAVVGAAAGTAAADRQPRHYTKAGQAAAHAAVLRRADLGASPGWTGGAQKPDLSNSTCANYHPKQSDLLLTGAAESDWKHAGLEFDSEAQVLQTARMVRLDWQRSVLAPQVLPCLRSIVRKGIGAHASLVSAKRLAFPRVAPFTAAFRTLLDVRSGSQKVRIMIDVVLIGRGRTELTLTTTAAYAAVGVVQPAELRLAQVMASRVRL